MLQFKTVMIEFGVAYSEPGAANRAQHSGGEVLVAARSPTRHATTDAKDCPLETRNCQWKAAIIAQVISYVQFFAQAAVQNLVRDPFFLMITSPAIVGKINLFRLFSDPRMGLRTLREHFVCDRMNAQE